VSRRLIATAAVLAAIAGVAAGCGTTEQQRDNAYVNQVNAVQRSFAAGIRSLQPGPAITSRAQAATVIGLFEVVLAQVEQRLRAIRAPETVSALHRKLIGVIAGYGADVRHAIDATRLRDRARLLASAARFELATQRVKSRIASTLSQINSRLTGSARVGS
jgi:hypothetical protein